MKIKKGDRVRVLTGKDRGKEGVVMTALPAKNKVVVEGVNTARKHQKRTRATMDAGLLDELIIQIGAATLVFHITP